MFTTAARCLLALQVMTVSSLAGEQNMSQRIDEVSAGYLGRPYLLGPLGEGVIGEVSGRPLEDEKHFDCTTYVETVLARTYARNDRDFSCVLKNVRYQGGEVSFLNRRHLPDSEWLPHQIELGILRDVTAQIGGGEVARVVEATVNRGEWLKGLGPADIKRNVPESEKAEVTAQLHRLAAEYSPVAVRLSYLPIAALSRADILAQLPSGAVFNVVRRSPRWIVRGKPVRIQALISHQGFLIRKGDQIFVRSATPLKNPRHASDTGARVRDIRLDDYLTYLRSIKDPKSGEENVLGLNIEVPQARPAGLCP